MPPTIQSNASLSSMSDVTLKELEKAIQQASNQYFRLVILAGVPGSGKTAALQYVAQKTGCQVVKRRREE